MNEREFVIWLKGFVTACHNHLPTPAQWDELVDTLNEVETSFVKFASSKKENIVLGTINVPEDYWKNEKQKTILND